MQSRRVKTHLFGKQSGASTITTSPPPPPTTPISSSATTTTTAFIQQQLQSIFRATLGTDVGSDESLLEKGADSLTGMELINAISARFRVSLPSTLLFDMPTPAELAGEIARVATAASRLPLSESATAVCDDDDGIQQNQRTRLDAWDGGREDDEELTELVNISVARDVARRVESWPLTQEQRVFWTFCALQPTNTAYHLNVLLPYPTSEHGDDAQEEETHLLRQCFRQTVAKHVALRAYFPRGDVQKILPLDWFDLSTTTIRAVSARTADDVEEEVEEESVDAIARRAAVREGVAALGDPMNLATGPLIRALKIVVYVCKNKMAATTSRADDDDEVTAAAEFGCHRRVFVLVTAHHIVADWRSLVTSAAEIRARFTAEARSKQLGDGILLSQHDHNHAEEEEEEEDYSFFYFALQRDHRQFDAASANALAFWIGVLCGDTQQHGSTKTNKLIVTRSDRNFSIRI